MATAARHAILLESGTNEVEILVFRIGQQRFGVNVAKVREVIEPIPVVKLPESPAGVLGMFQLRNTTLPLIDLPLCLGRPATDDLSQCRILVLEFNEARVGFVVHALEHIHRTKLTDVEAMPEITAMQNAPVTSVAHLNGDLVLMLDFEKTVLDIAGFDPFAASAQKITNNPERRHRRILLAEDSVAIRTLIESNLELAGYSTVTACQDGQLAWEKLEQSVEAGADCCFDFVITDIEMPRMDGLHLTRRIKEHEKLKHLPVVVFSSLVSADNDKKCKSVGADAQITKPELAKLVQILDNLAEGRPALAT